MTDQEKKELEPLIAAVGYICEQASRARACDILGLHTVTVSRLLSGKGMPQRRVLARLSVCGEPTVSQAAKDILAWHKKEARRKYEALKKIGVSPPKRLRLQFERLKP